MEGNKKIRVAINGLGRIGRAFLRAAMERPELEIIAVNDLGDASNLAYLLKYDTAYGQAKFEIKLENGSLLASGRKIIILQEKDPSKLPWKDLNIDVAVECTGLFENYAKARVHLDAGAKKVVISAPAKEGGEGGATVLMGINEEALKTYAVTSNASCTTNAAAPVMEILNKTLGIEKAMLNTVHGYTATQKIVDAPDAKDFRRGRAAAANIVPSSTGAAISVTEAIPELKNLFNGIALRVPILVGSIADITFVAKRATTTEEINDILRAAAKEERWKDIFSVTEEELVSSDILGSPYASIADLKFTRVTGGNLVKVLVWYDNESGYTHTLINHVIKAGQSV